MTIDHIGIILYEEYIILRIIGRLSFPIFCYLLVLGVESTRNWKNYFTRLFIFALISQIPYFLVFGFNPFEQLNIFFTLSFGVLFLYCYNKNILLALLPVVASVILNVDYSLYGIAMMGCIFVLKKDVKKGVVALILLNILFYIPNIAQYTQMFSLFAIPIILLHQNGPLKIERMVNWTTVYSSLRKYAFYAYYPLHLALFFLIK